MTIRKQVLFCFSTIIFDYNLQDILVVSSGKGIILYKGIVLYTYNKIE
jgi:hypothetical protein